MPRRARPRKPRAVEAITHDDARRPNLPSAEHQPVMSDDDKLPLRVEWERRNPDLDPQLVWRGKAQQDDDGLAVDAPPLYIQERIHPKHIIDDLVRVTAGHRAHATDTQFDLFADFNGLPSPDARTQFYQHHARWANRMILGDSLQVMASLAERERLRGMVQCIYLDPPYGIRFNSNFQWSATSRDVRDGKPEHITREPEQVRAFRDTWRDGVHSYLSYLRDRLIAARDLLADSGSIFVQIGDENVHRVRALMDEVFGVESCISQISFSKTSSFSSKYLSNVSDHLLWYAKNPDVTKYRQLATEKRAGEAGGSAYREIERMSGNFQKFDSRTRLARSADLTSQGASANDQPLSIFGTLFPPRAGMHWKTRTEGLRRLGRAGRLGYQGRTPAYLRFLNDFPIVPFTNNWADTGVAGYAADKRYVVQTLPKVIERCILMTTDPGDLVLDPTCGSGTTAYVAEQWGRRWITIDTSRVALALARARIMGARYEWWKVAGGEWKVESGAGDDAGAHPANHSSLATNHSRSDPAPDLRLGFEYETVPHIQLRDIANNAEIDVIWDERQPAVEAALAALNGALRGHGTPFAVETGARAGRELDFRVSPGATETLPSGEEAPLGGLLEWEAPREAPADWPEDAAAAHGAFVEARRARQAAIDESIARNAAYEELYDRPRADTGIVRVAGPFTVESVSPHRTLTADAEGGFADGVEEERAGYGQDFAGVMLQNLRTAGVRQAARGDAIAFASLTPWPGRLVCAEGVWEEGGEQRHAGVFIGPEFGTVSRADLVEAAREAGEAGFDALIACAFAYDAHSTEFESLGRVRVLKARMNADLHMAGELKTTGAGGSNLFVIFGEPDILVASEEWLVTGGGREVAPYELATELAGLGSLAELNAAGREALASLRASADDGAERAEAVAALRGLAAADFPLAVEQRTRVRLRGVDVYDPAKGEVRSDGPEGIACWFIDTDYNEEAFFVRHAYFPGTIGDPYKALRTTLKAEVDEEAWATLRRDVSRPFAAPTTGRIAVKVINHLGDEAMKVYRVGGDG